MYKGYSWSCSDVLSLLGVRYNPGKEEQIIPCPFCGGKRFAMNIRKGTGHCFNCSSTADSASYYAAEMGMSLNDARNDIRHRLNVPDETGKIPERRVFKEVPQEEMAPIEQRDAAYRAFLDELTISQKNYDNLLARGFSSDDIEALGYKTYPSADTISFESLCRRLLAKGIVLDGVPGFSKNDYNEWTIPRYTQGIIVPQVNYHNQIEGLQIRKDDDLRREFDGNLEGKCTWFSTKGKYCGVAAHTSIHCAMDFIYDNTKHQYIPILNGGKVTLTEGGMKADLVHCLLDGKASLISVPGIYALAPLKQCLIKLKEYGLTTVNIAFDMDYLTNKNVKISMETVSAILKELDLKEDNVMNWEFKKKDRNGKEFFLKGIDDYLAYEYKKIIPVVTRK